MKYEKETPKAYLARIDKNIIYLKYKLDVNFELADAIEVNNLIFEMSNGDFFSVIVDGRGNKGNITNEARSHYATDPKTKNIRLAEALIIDNIATRIFSRLYIKVNKPNNPVKIFQQYDDALDWVNGIMKNI